MRFLVTLYFVFLPGLPSEVVSIDGNIAQPIDLDTEPVHRNAQNPKLAATLYFLDKRNRQEQEDNDKGQTFLERVRGIRSGRQKRALYFEMKDNNSFQDKGNNCVRCDNEKKPISPDDPKINWICGAYQESFKNFVSVCEMIYFNCMNDMDYMKVGELKCPIAKPQGKDI